MKRKNGAMKDLVMLRRLFETQSSRVEWGQGI